MCYPILRASRSKQYQRIIKHDLHHTLPCSTANQNLGHDQGNFVMTKNVGRCGLMKDRLSPAKRITLCDIFIQILERPMPRNAKIRATRGSYVYTLRLPDDLREQWVSYCERNDRKSSSLLAGTHAIPDPRRYATRGSAVGGQAG